MKVMRVLWPSFEFQHAAARRRLALPSGERPRRVAVSTRSRPKAAGNVRQFIEVFGIVSTRSRPKAAGKGKLKLNGTVTVSTRSRPKAAGH